MSNQMIPSNMDASSAQALVAVGTAKLQKNINNLENEVTSTMSAMQVQSTKASFSQAANQVMMGVYQAVDSGLQAAGSAGMAYGAGKGISEENSISKEFDGENGSITQANNELNDISNQRQTLKEGTGIREEEPGETAPNQETLAQEELQKRSKLNNLNLREKKLTSEKDKLIRDKKSKAQVARDKSQRRNLAFQALQNYGRTVPQMQQQTEQAEATRNQAAGKVADSAERSINSYYDSCNALIRDAQGASDTYQVSVAAARG